MALFATCLVDQVRPQVGHATLRLLRSAGLTVVVPAGQTCCGQPALNSGYRAVAAAAALHWTRTFAGQPAVVAPSGSCVALIRHHLAALVAEELPRAVLRAGETRDGLQREAERLAGCTWELSEFLVRVLGVEPAGARWQEGPVAFHPSCHGLRELGIGGCAETLLAGVADLPLVEQQGREECCGFGGLFAVDQPELSTALRRQKRDALRACGARWVTGCDVSCLLHLDDPEQQDSDGPRSLHLAELLERALLPPAGTEPTERAGAEPTERAGAEPGRR